MHQDFYDALAATTGHYWAVGTVLHDCPKKEVLCFAITSVWYIIKILALSSQNRLENRKRFLKKIGKLDLRATSIILNETISFLVKTFNS